MSTRMFKFFFLQSVLISSLFLSACTEGDRKFVSIPDVEIEEEPLPIVIKAAGVKGPLVNAEIGLYKLDLNTGLIKQHGDASEAFYRLLALANLNPDGSIPENAGTTAIEALVFIQDHIKALGYVTALPRLQSEIKESETTDQARLALIKYLDVAGEERETNAIPKAKVQKIFDNFATLGELKTKISSLSPFTTQLSELTSLSSAKSLINKFRASETDSAKEKGWLAIRNTFQNSTTSLSSLRSDLSDQFFALSDNNNLEEDSVALNRLDQLKQDVSVAATIEIAESLISQAITEEGNVSVRQSLSALKTSIISLDDFISQAQMDNALYHFAGIKNVILNQIARILDLDGNPILNPIVTPEIVLGDMYTASFNALSAELEPSLAEAFKNETLDFFGEPTNQLIKNVSGANSLLEGVNLGEYSGFVYMEVSSLSNTVDLNSGTKPIISTLNTIFHTDEIRGYGNNSKENRTLYFLKDGQEQRDSEGALITDLTMLEKNENNIILEVQPYRFATPLTKLAISLITERFKRFEPQLTDTNGDGELEYRITDSALKSELKAASNTIVKTFRLAELYDQSIYEAPAILTLPMQYSDADQENAVQHRAMIENFSAFINSLIQETNLNTDILFSAVVKDLLDNEMDGLEFDQQIESLNSVSDVAFLVKRSPTDVYIPGVNITINEIASLMSSQLKIVELEFPVPAVFDGNISFDPPRGGLDSDNDGYLNNTDTFPNDSTKHNDVGTSYSGVWGLSVTNSLNFIVPFSGELSYSITRQEESAKASLPECDNVGESCLFEGDSGSDIDVSWEVIRGPESGNLQIKSTFSDNTAIGFNAIGSVPGVYQVRLKLVTVVEPVQTYSRIIPIKIMNPQDLEIRFNPEAPKAGEIVNVEFQATDEICRPYDFCDETQLGQYFDIENLSELTATWNINGGKSNQYRTFEQISDVPKVYFNTSNGETLNIDVVYSAGSTELEFVEFIAAKHSAVVGLKTNSDSDDFADDIDAFPNNSDCYRQTDGFVNDLGEETCNTNIINNETTPNPKSLTISLNDQIWLYDENWDRIFRTYSEDGETRFFDSIVMPRKNGVTNVVADFLVDEETRRVYIVYSDGEIDYFSFDDNQLHEFSDPHKNLPVASILPVGLVVLVEYKDGVEPSEFKLYQRNGDLSVIQAKSKYPKPGLPVEIDIDGNSITEFAQTFQLQWVLTRLVGDIPTDISVSTSDDSLVLLSGQTAYGDLLTVSFVDSDDVIVKKVTIAVLDTLEFNLEKATYKTTEILTILSGAYDLNSAETKKFIQVKWLKYDKIKDSNEFQSLDLSFPFSYLPSSAGAVNGDIITAEVYLKTGADSDLLLETEFALILEKELLDGFTFEYSQEPEFDPSDKESFQVQISKPTRDDKYFAEHFTPVWLLDGVVVEGENGLTFPSNSTTNIKFGSTLTLSFNYQIGSTAGTTPETEVITFDLDILITEYQLFPTFPEPGDDITIDFEDFEAGALIQYVPKWFINGEEDKSAITLTYPGEDLKFGDHIELRLSEKDRNPDDELLPQAFTDTAEIYVGLNVFNPSLEAGIDSDGDTVLNKNDYFRYDAACFAESDGNPDDMDGDGLSDLKELLPGIIIANRTNPNTVDTDQDGLSDYEELIAGSDPNKADSDDDGFKDGLEVIKLSTDPMDNAVPGNIENDLDRDGISNEDELVLGSFVNQVDSDNDGLFDGMELTLGTGLLNPDSDGDGLSDGLEVYITKTKPLVVDSDEDGISDGVEVRRLNFNPMDDDTNDDGILDSLELAAANVVALPLNDYLNLNDLNDYIYSQAPAMVSAGTCYSTWLGQQEIDRVVVSHEPQVDAESDQQILFTQYEWSEIIRYDVKNSTFLAPLTAQEIKGNVSAIEYDASNINIQYLGYLNGMVRKYDANSKTLKDLFFAGPSVRIEHIMDQETYLLVEVRNSVTDAYTHYLIDKVEEVPVSSTPLSSIPSDLSYKNSTWVDNSIRSELILIGDELIDTSLIKETVDIGNPPSISQSVLKETDDMALKSPMFIEEFGGEIGLSFGSGQVLNLTTGEWLARITPFELGLQHDSLRITAPKNTSQIKRNYRETLAGSIEWESTQQSANDQVLNVVPVGIDTLVISHRTNGISQLYNQPPLAFELTSGDFDNDGLSDRREVQLGTDIGNPDTDGDGLTDGQEVSKTNTNPLIQDVGIDTDGDGLSDSVELNQTHTDINSTNNDDQDADFDNDGLSNFIEINQTLTNPSLNDTNANGVMDGDEDFDQDGLTNLQELNVTKTSLVDAYDVDDDNKIKDGDQDRDDDGLSDSLELNHIDSDTNEPFYDFDDANTDLATESIDDQKNDGDEDFDGDALTNRVEVESTNTDPWVADTDGDGINDGAEDRDSDGLSDSQELSTLRFDFENADSDANGTNDGDEDTDDDGLKNSKEFQFSLTSYLTGDSDGDGLSDYAEVVTYGTNPLLKDTDGDSIEDKVEIEPTIPADPASDPTSADADGDGLTDPVELDFKSNPKLSDTDGDGLDDKFEFEFVLEYSESELEAYGYDEEIYSIDPNLSDTDGDDFTDAEEVALTYNPALSDTDNDNLSDYVEHHGINGFKTNPKLRDTDGDGLNDGDEILKTMTDPLDTDSNDNGILDGDEDRDQDGLSDKAELYLTLTNIEEKDSDGNGIEDGFEDPDNDNLNNLAEIELKTNPHLVDSDDDGVPDDKESAESALNPDTDGDGLTDGDEVNPPEGVFDSDPNLVDTDGDGLPDNEERKSGSDPRNVDTDNDFLLDGDDLAVSLLNWDADSDGIPDGIERHFLNTSPTSKDSDQDGLPDNEEVWVYAIPENEIIGPDGLISENQLVRIGMNVTYEVDGEEVIGPNVKLNSRFGDANFIASKFSNNDKDRKVMTVTRVNSVNDPNTNENVTLYIRSISSPDMIDTDGDELSDFTELMQIEREFAANSFDPNVGTSDYDPNKLNSENFMISDPWLVDTDKDGVNDGAEDIDKDFYSNVLEQGNENSDIVSPHSDTENGDPASFGDGILDGLEVLLLSSSANLVDSDEDGLDDNEELMDVFDIESHGDLKTGPLVCRVMDRVVGLNQDVACFDDFSTLPVVSNPCRETEVILSNIAGVSYCFKVNFDSLPSEMDSDNDGVLDPDDFFALDPSCSLEVDGFLDAIINKKQCFSSWMAQQSGIEQIDNAQWVDDVSAKQSQLAFYSDGWDKVVRFDTLEASYVSHIDVDNSDDAAKLVKVDYSLLSRRLYLAYADGNIKYIDLVSGAEFELVAGYLDVSTKQLDTIVVAGTNVIVQLKDATKYSHFIYNAAGQQALGALAGADDFNLKEAFWDQVSSRLYGFQQAVGQAISNLGFVNIDEVNNRFDGGIIYSSSLSAETGLSGPIALSQDGVSVYLGSGQKRLAALGENDDIDPNLVKTYKTSTFTRFRELIELGDHFVGVVDIKEGSDQVNPPIRNGLFIQDIADLSASGAINNRYLFKKNENKEILKLVPFIDVDPELIFVSKYPNRVVIDSLGLKDEDGDGMTGIYETFYNLDDADAGDRFSDPDEDFLTNIEEFNLATNPINEDTDGDSWHDADEVINATNPLDAADF